MSVEVWASWSKLEEGKPYAARLLGLDSRYGFERQFIPRSRVNKSRSGLTGSNCYILDQDGIYEVQSRGRKGPQRRYLLVRGGQAEEIDVERARELLREGEARSREREEAREWR